MKFVDLTPAGGPLPVDQGKSENLKFVDLTPAGGQGDLVYFRITLRIRYFQEKNREFRTPLLQKHGFNQLQSANDPGFALKPAATLEIGNHLFQVRSSSHRRQALPPRESFPKPDPRQTAKGSVV